MAIKDTRGYGPGDPLLAAVVLALAPTYGERPPPPPVPAPPPIGWRCPGCRRVFAPHVAECRKCRPRGE